MASNSIICNINKDDIIADIRLTLGADYSHKKAIVVVEGKDDIKFLNGRLSNNVDLYESFSGKEGVREIVTYFGEKRVLGICDRDYIEFDNSVNIVYYDKCCLEMMIVSNLNVFKEFSKNFYYGHDSADELLTKIFSNLKWLSCFRKLNSEYSWGINFGGVSISAAYNKADMNISIDILLKKITDINHDLIQKHREYLLTLSNEVKKEFDFNTYLNITQGHDFISYFQSISQSSSPFPKGVSIDTLFSGLCCAFRDEDFTNTDLFHTLNTYCDKCDIKILA